LTKLSIEKPKEISTEASPYKSKVTIAGAGPVGAMLAIILARANFQVDVFDSRPDPRSCSTQQGKSINITLSERAWIALTELDLDKQVRQYATPLYKKIFHQLSGGITEQTYGNNSQAIWSISREKLTEILLNQAEQELQRKIHFEQRLTHIDFNSACSSFSYVKAGKKGHREIDADYVFAADGAFSKVRRLAQETPRFSYSQRYMKQCYIELSIANNKDGSAKLAENVSHIWPREDFSLMALPNSDGSFTCTLYLNYQGENSFSSLTTPKSVKYFFEQNFADVMPLLESPIETFLNKIANPLFLVSVDPWVINNKVALIGDAAHAMVPFYGQGLNCSFEDCLALSNIIKSCHGNLAQVLPIYYQQRKINADAISKLSKTYFLELSGTNSNDELLSKNIANKFAKAHPTLWPSVDDMINFSPEMSYAKARAISLEQRSIMNKIMQINNIEQCWQQDFVYQQLEALVLKKLLPLLKPDK
jgi:kynurenine 3-monooxygenase